MTSKMRDDPWTAITSDASEIVGRRVDGVHALAIYWVRSNEGAPGLLIRSMDPQAVPRALPKPRGIGIQVTAGEHHSSSLRLVLHDSENRDVFLALCRDVIESSAKETLVAAATASVFRRLSRWHALLSRGRSVHMGPQEIRGFIGELCFLETLADSIGHPAALQAWVAPDDHPQDFAVSTSIIEVKTRLSGSRPQVQISSLEQLESAHLPLNLLVFELAPSTAEYAFSLNDMAARMVAQYQPLGIAMQEAAETALAARGYVRKDDYGVDTYEVAGVRGFRVGPEFPRLTRTAVDARIREATYVLDLTSLARFETDPAKLIPQTVP